MASSPSRSEQIPKGITDRLNRIEAYASEVTNLASRVSATFATARARLVNMPGHVRARLDSETLRVGLEWDDDEIEGFTFWIWSPQGDNDSAPDRWSPSAWQNNPISIQAMALTLLPDLLDEIAQSHLQRLSSLEDAQSAMNELEDM